MYINAEKLKQKTRLKKIYSKISVYKIIFSSLVSMRVRPFPSDELEWHSSTRRCLHTQGKNMVLPKNVIQFGH
jgi:hypothetical protein